MKIRTGSIIIDLTKSEEELWNGLRKDKRKSIKKARKEGLTICQGTEKDKERCYELYKKTCKINYLVPKSKKQIFRDEIFQVVKLKDKVLGFLTANIANGIPTVARTSSDYDYRHLYGGVLLRWETIVYLKKLKYKQFDQGGIDLHAKYRESNDDYKKSWGGQIYYKEQNTNILTFLWWKYLRHNQKLRKLKYHIQKRITQRRSFKK